MNLNISSPESATLLARIERAGIGPCLAAIRGGEVVDVTCKSAPTCRDICEHPCPSDLLNDLEGERIGTVEEVFANSVESDAKSEGPRFLSPCDLQAIKACGVTFVGSMIERVIEERAEGDPGEAQEVRARIGRKVGMQLENIVPGSEEAGKIKQGSGRRRAVVAILGSRNRSVCGGLHQSGSPVFCRARSEDRTPSRLAMEQSGTGIGSDHQFGRKNRRRNIGQRRQFEGFRRPVRFAARPRERQQCLMRAGAVHPIFRRGFRHRRVAEDENRHAD